MSVDSEIGRVVAVDTAHVRIELNPEIRGMVRKTYEEVQEVGRINSYIILPVSGQRLVAIVTRVVLGEDIESKGDRKAVRLRAARRLMDATLIGTIKGTSFSQGVSSFPVLDNPVHLADNTDLDAILGSTENPSPTSQTLPRLRFRIPVGESTNAPKRPIRIDPDTFFGKHAAIIGSTGSGKSCTIATLLQAIHEREDVKRTTCIILDTNGEYRTAFQQESDDHIWTDAGPCKTRYIPTGPSDTVGRLAIPYWIMNSEDFLRIFRASQGVQAPVLIDALRLARNDGNVVSSISTLREEIVTELNRISSESKKYDKTSKTVRNLAKGLKLRINEEEFMAAWDAAASAGGLSRGAVTQALESIEKIADKLVDRDTFPNVIPANSRKKIQDHIKSISEGIHSMSPSPSAGLSGLTADTPSYFDKLRFRTHHIDQVLLREESGGARSREHSGTMLLRIDRLLADPRFEFLFGPVGQSLPRPAHVLAAFIRDLLGISPAHEVDLSDERSVPLSLLPFYDRQRSREPRVDVVILDMSLLASEVIENVAALIGRIILEFLQHLGEGGDDNSRGSLPVVLVLEEAQNYIRQPRVSGEESISRDVFERIAREGRKYGLGLVVASQRPSELSKTVLSQCNSFIVHRLQNPEDLRYFKEIVPGVYKDMLGQIPALAPQTALVLGECVSAPVLVRVRDALPIPRSQDPQFYQYWVAEHPAPLDVESICRDWEAGGRLDTLSEDE